MTATATETPHNRKLVRVLARCHNDPALFNAAVLGRAPFWWRQVEMARSIVQYRDTVAYSGNAIGKDYFVGSLIPWWLYTRANSLVIVTGPGQTLLGSVTWKEARRAIEGSRIPLDARISRGIKPSPLTIEVTPGWHALGYSTDSVERASGQHARKLLVIVVEASGLEDEQWGALRSLKYTRLFAIGNPLRAEGEFVKMIRQAARDRAAGVPSVRAVNAIHIPSTDSPHAHLDESPYGLADKTWIEAETRRYGRDSLWVRSHIHALIPDISYDDLIAEAWLDYSASASAVRRYAPRHERAGVRRISCDLGEGVGRDSSAIFVRDDHGILDFDGGSTMGLGEAAAAIARLRLKWAVEPEDISYDRVGIGKNLHLFLAKYGIEHAVGYVGSGKAQGTEFTNLRTEAAWKLRNRLDPELAPDPARPETKQPPFVIPMGAPWWPRLRAELKALTYDLVGRKTRLISKEDLVTKLGHSPDYGDALLQSFAFN